MKAGKVKVKAKAKADILAKAWTQAVKQAAPSPVVCAPPWGSCGAEEGPAIETPFVCWTTEADAEAAGVWPEVDVGALKKEEFETNDQADHEMRIMDDRVTPSAIYLDICIFSLLIRIMISKFVLPYKQFGW